MEYSDIIVEHIRFLCKKRGFSVNRLSEMSGVKQSTLDNIMQKNTKNPGIVTLHKLATAFNMTISEFLDFKELNEYSFDDQPESHPTEHMFHGDTE